MSTFSIVHKFFQIEREVSEPMNQSDSVLSTEFNVSALLDAARSIGQRDAKPKARSEPGELPVLASEKKFS